MTTRLFRTVARAAGAVLAAALAAPACHTPAEPDPNAPAWVALDKACPADAPATSLPDSLRATLRTSGGLRTVDDEYAAIAREVPGGWGGIWTDRTDNDRAVIALVDPSQREAAVAKLTAFGVGGGRFDLRRARVVKVRWDYAQLYDWYRYLNPHVWEVSNVVISDIQELNNRIEYGVLDEVTRQRIGRRLAELDIPCFLVAVGISQPVIVQGQ